MKEKGLEFIKNLDRYANIDVEYIIKSDEDTDPSYGYLPTQRPIDIHIRNGIIIVDKPPGPTSHEVVAWIKKMFNIPKAGHGGTLEPGHLFLSTWSGGEIRR